MHLVDVDTLGAEQVAFFTPLHGLFLEAVPFPYRLDEAEAVLAHFRLTIDMRVAILRQASYRLIIANDLIYHGFGGTVGYIRSVTESAHILHLPDNAAAKVVEYIGFLTAPEPYRLSDFYGLYDRLNR